jgi:hypothetical protein
VFDLSLLLLQQSAFLVQQSLFLVQQYGARDVAARTVVKWRIINGMRGGKGLGAVWRKTCCYRRIEQQTEGAKGVRDGMATQRQQWRTRRHRAGGR